MALKVAFQVRWFMRSTRIQHICLLLGIISTGLLVAGSNNGRRLSIVSANEDSFSYLPLMLNKQTVIPPEILEVEQSVARMINDQRAFYSLAGYTLATELTQAARGHSRDMADNHFTGHTGSDGSTPLQRILAAGYDAWAWGETIGWGFGGDSSAMVNWWMNSPVHRSLILSGTLEDFGVGYTRDPGSDYGHYWTVNFADRSAAGNVLDQQLFRCTFSFTGQEGGSSLMVYTTNSCR